MVIECLRNERNNFLFSLILDKRREWTRAKSAIDKFFNTNIIYYPQKSSVISLIFLSFELLTICQC